MEDGLDHLLATLETAGGDRVPLPGLEEPARPCEYVRMILVGFRDRGADFETAWAAAVNRLQPSQMGGVADAALALRLREERALIEENRQTWQAAYEGRTLEPRERALQISAAWRRLDGPISPTRRPRRRAAA